VLEFLLIIISLSAFSVKVRKRNYGHILGEHSFVY